MKTRTTKSISFLMEFIIVLCFFCVAALICVSIYVNSHQMNVRANEGKRALSFVQNYIESLPDRSLESTQFYVDKNFRETSKDPHYRVDIHKSEDLAYTITVFEGTEEVVQLPFALEIGGLLYE